VKEHLTAPLTLPLPTRKQLSGWLRRGLAIAMALVLSFAPAAPSLLAAPAPAKARPTPSPDTESGSGDCDLNSARGEIQHVIYIQFDNVHFTRDNPNVPSDLEQMPHLLNFIKNNGVLSTNHHTPLISHTADDIVTSLTGVYGDRHGIPVANGFGYFLPTQTPANFDGFSSSFTYWTDPLDLTNDPTPIMLAANGKNAPAPWAPYTRAGCNVGAVSTANIELENVGSDLIKIYGANSPEVAEANTNFDKAVADFEGISIHCASGNSVCSSANGGEPDLLPDEPGGYTGFNGLFGHKFVAPVINPGAPLKDLDGNMISDQDSPPNIGFPGFGGISAAQSLAYVAAMQEHGVPVTYAYISDAHDNHTTASSPANQYGPAECATDPEQGDGFGDAGLGPGDACYVAQLAAYDEAFGKFFARLAQDGINQSNTLFVITADEGDHFAGGPPTPSTCDGVTITCAYSKLGEINSNIADLLAKEDPGLAGKPFDMHYDMAPTFYVEGNPAPGDPLAREFERAAAKLTATSPITGNIDKLTRYLADPVEEKLLHMVTDDPLRTPTFTMFGNPDYYFVTYGSDALEGSGYSWNHGGVAPEINGTWLGLVGPGVTAKGIDDELWSDHTDIRPTMLVLLGLKDDYSHEGRALVEDLQDWALPTGVSKSGDGFTELAQAYKAINAPVGELGLKSLRVSTQALAGSDSTYTNLENKLSGVTAARDILADEMSDLLEGAEFGKKQISAKDASTLVQESQELLEYVESLAGH
jgi:hypothetical protein